MTSLPATVSGIAGAVRPARVRPGWLAVGVLTLVGTGLLALLAGAVGMPARGILLEVLDRFPLVEIDSGLTDRQGDIIWKIRLPRVVLGMLVGAMLSLAGASYQGVFRNPLADPFLLGTSAGAGLGATLAIVHGLDGLGPFDGVPVAAFLGALAGVGLTYVLANIGGRDRSPAVLLLAGVAVAAFLAAFQTFLQQRNTDVIREVYSWLLGRLLTSGWDDVTTVLPYAVVSSLILLAHRRILDVLAVGDDEASTLGLDVRRARVVVIATASLATAAAVSVSGLIGFVGIIVPHTVRLLAGSSYRVILPLSLLFGGSFLVAADLVARTAMSPAEIPIGVVTALVGAPFFAVVLRSRKQMPL